MTNLRSLPDLFRAAGKLAAVCFFATALTAAASAQTNTFPTSGNAGVGTTTPSIQSGTTNTMIEVKGTVNPGVGLTSTAAGGRQFFLYSSQANPGYFSVFDATAGADRFVINSSGNVGIGTSTPNARFVIGSGNFGLGTNSLATWSHSTSVIESLDTSIFFGLDTDIGLNSNAYHNGGWKYKTSDLAANIHIYKGDIYFRTAGTGTADAPLTWTNSMFVRSDGNVAIGTTSPGNYRLNVGGPLLGRAIYSSYVDDGLYGATAIPSRISTYNFNGGILFGYEDMGLGDYSPRVGFQQTYDAVASPATTTTKASIGLVRNGNITIKGGASNTEFVRIDNSGSVGIGIIPSYKLDVNGEINATGIRINGTPISAGGSSPWSGSNPIYYTGGNVGIGTTSPGAGGYGQAKLDVVGRGRIRSDGTLTAGIWFNDSPTASGTTDQAFVGRSGLATTGFFSAGGWVFNVHDNGNVGIGTTTPASSLQIGTQASVASATPTTLSLGGSHSNAAGANLKLKLYDDGVAANTYGIGVSSGSMDFGVHSSAGYRWYAGGVNKMTLTSNGDLSVSGNIAAKYQDLAEWVPATEQLSAATVVVLDPTKSNQVISSTQSYDTRVAGVISAQPGITLGESGEGKVLVATTGRVRVKVDASRAPIQIGDLLVTSDVPGVAMKSEPVEFAGRKMHMPGTIIGKALEPLANGRGEILVLLSLQ